MPSSSSKFTPLFEDNDNLRSSASYCILGPRLILVAGLGKFSESVFRKYVGFEARALGDEVRVADARNDAVDEFGGFLSELVIDFLSVVDSPLI